MTLNEALKIVTECGLNVEAPAHDEVMKQITEALEKQIPYKPKEYEDKFYACKCGNCVLYKWEHYPDVLTPKEIEGLPFCLGCGQKLDWSD